MAENFHQKEIQMGAQGRLVVPARLRKVLGMNPGDALVARVEDGRLIIEKAEAVKRRVRAAFGKLKERSLAAELIADRRDEARREKLE
jgi:AbrB family looped-hinge helix DNA binding protein